MTLFIRAATACAFFSVSLSAGGFAAAAQPSEDEAIDAAIACRDIQDPMERLACLDAAAETLSVTRIIQEEELAEQEREEREAFGLAGRDRGDKDKTPAPRVAETEEDFGREALPEERRAREDGRLKNITAKIAEISVNRFGKVTVTLENGQVWRQLDSDDRRLLFPKGDRLYTARVKRSLFGNYMMTVEELDRTVRVRRIQ